jgi:hypothetical protein
MPLVGRLILDECAAEPIAHYLESLEDQVSNSAAFGFGASSNGLDRDAFNQATITCSRGIAIDPNVLWSKLCIAFHQA